MAYTALKGSAIEEHFDSKEKLQESGLRLAELIKKCHHMVVFTGAGVSTLCGIPDFRGPKGVWTLAAAGETRQEPVTHASKAIPSFTHMAFVELQKRGILKFVISQNCDGLHRKSGMPPECMAELHGNRNLERCSKCGKEYLRDYDAVAPYIFSVSDHRTTRNCVACGGALLDSIINFGDNLPQQQLDSAWSHTKSSDLFLVMGSSLTVAPACHMPEYVGKNKDANLVICNLQNTPYDNLATVRIYSQSDDVMKVVMNELNIPVPSFQLTRYVGVNVDVNKLSLHVYGIDSDGTPASLFPEMIIMQKKLDSEPFIFEFLEQQQNVEIELIFYGHYNEPNLKLNVACDYNYRKYFQLKYDPLTGVWQVEDKGSSPPSCFGPTYQPLPFPSLVDSSGNAKSNKVGFSVHPRSNCSHFQREVVLSSSSLIAPSFNNNKCDICSDASENWFCLTCGKTFCSRYVKGHAKIHSEETNHHVALSFSDLSVWCYACNDYIKDNLLSTMFVGELYKVKFDN